MDCFDRSLWVFFSITFSLFFLLFIFIMVDLLCWSFFVIIISSWLFVEAEVSFSIVEWQKLFVIGGVGILLTLNGIKNSVIFLLSMIWGLLSLISCLVLHIYVFNRWRLSSVISSVSVENHFCNCCGSDLPLSNRNSAVINRDWWARDFIAFDEDVCISLQWDIHASMRVFRRNYITLSLHPSLENDFVLFDV